MEDKLLVELILNPVHLASDDAEERLAVNQDLDTILLDHFVELSWLVDVLEVVGETTAPTVLDSDLDQLWLWLIEQVTQCLDSSWRKLDCCLSCAEPRAWLSCGSRLGRACGTWCWRGGLDWCL